MVVRFTVSRFTVLLVIGPPQPILRQSSRGLRRSNSRDPMPSRSGDRCSCLGAKTTSYEASLIGKARPMDGPGVT